MALTRLTKRNYLGKGYFHYFEHNLTGEIVKVECTKEEYERLGRKGGGRFHPTRADHRWHHSEGGTIKVDNPDFELRENEYAEIGNQVCIRHTLSTGCPVYDFLDKEQLVDEKINLLTLRQKYGDSN